MVSLGSAIGQGATIAIVIKAVDEFSATFKQATKGSKLLTTAVTGAAGLAAGFAVLGASSLKIAADMEQTRIAFNTMLGSVEEGGKLMEDVFEFARQTPFEVKGVIQATKQLLAYGITQEEVLKDLESLGNIAAGVGRDKLPNLILAFGQVRAAGRLTGQELRQFTEAGVPILEELAKQLDTTTSNIKDMVSAGEVSFDDVRTALENLSGEGGRFENLMGKQMDSTEGKFSNVRDAIFQMQLALGEFLLPVVSEFATVLLDEVLPSIEPLIPALGENMANALGEMLKNLVPMIPSFIELSEKMIELMPTAIKLLEVFGEIAPTLITVTDGLIPLVEWIGKLLDLMVRLSDKLEVLSALSALASNLNVFTGFGRGGNEENVGDAIIRPDGSVIHTDPRDTLLAMKNFNGMGGGLVIQIENIYGVDAEDISQALSDELNNKISL